MVKLIASNRKETSVGGRDDLCLLNAFWQVIIKIIKMVYIVSVRIG